ncbi:MAG TPA: DUF4157 domain-containing protein, partial [Thermoanaerobaculia bacterium]|nr:DUF4157 domain-containing protein [Thermoanaerobaculia bacterium]
MEPVRAPQTEKPRLERERQPERRREKEPLGGEQVAAPGTEHLPFAGSAGAALPRGGSPAGLLALQRLVGNRQVRRMVALAREDPAMLQGGEVSDEIESGIQAARGGGQPLDSTARGHLEPAFGADFGGVRIHTGSQADQLNRGLSARAFTTGSDIFFRQGEYNPGSSSGRELLAHELTHVVQQGGAGATGETPTAPEGEAQAKLTVGAVDDPFEREADSVARAVMDDERRDSGTVRRMPIVQRAPAVQRKSPKAPGAPPVVISGSTFEDIAAAFSQSLQEQFGVDSAEKLPKVCLIVVNGGNVRIFDAAGKPVGGRSFRFKRPVDLPLGVFVAGPGRKLYGVLQGEKGKWGRTQGSIIGNADFSRDIEDQEAFNAITEGFSGGYYIVPQAEAGGPPPEESPPQDQKPDILKIQATGRADLPAWPSAVIPLTSPVTAAGSVGSFVCRLDKYNPWVGLLANVTANMEPMAFAWEVLELGDRLTVQGKDTATRWKGAMAGYEVRARHLEDDEKTRLGTGKKQGIPEQLFRQFYNEQIKDQRAILAYAGQTVLTIVKTFAGQPDNPRIEDIIDYKFDKPGNYFVRCLATPIVSADQKGAKRRATSVAGVMVSVFDIASLAEASVGTVESEQEKSENRRKDWAADLDRLKEIKQKGDAKELSQHPFLDYEIWKAEQEIAFEEQRGKAAGDEHQLLVIQRDFLKLQIERLNGPDRPKPGRQAHQAALKATVDELQARLKSLEDKIGRADSKLGGATRKGTMPGVLVDDTTGGRTNLLFSIGEHTRVNADELEVVIADITSEKGRMFTGSGSGWQGDGRTQAWTLAMRDLRRNLGRGRGYLAFRAPEPYASLKDAAVDNPMKLEISEIDQLKETVDDAAHALTLAALIAAPFTGGASLSILAVLAPIQAGSSLYNIVNRAMYDDLHLDAEAIGDIANIATLGLAKVGPAGKFATSGARIFVTSSRVALQVFDKGQFVVIGWTTWQALTAEDPPGTDPREAKTRKIMALLSLLEAGAIPVASHLWPNGVRPKEAAQPKPGETPGQPRPGDAGTPKAEGTPPETLSPTPKDGAEAQRPAEPAPKTPPQAEPGTTPQPDAPAGAKPAGASEVHPDLLKSLPKDVAGKIPAVHNPDLPAGTVRLVYEIDPATGVITELRMEIGPGTSEMIVAAHGRTAQTMLRYKGLSGRVRLLYEQVSAWISGNPQAKPGTRAWEARLEIEKLGRIITERVAVYEAADGALKEQLRHELDSL